MTLAGEAFVDIRADLSSLTRDLGRAQAEIRSKLTGASKAAEGALSGVSAAGRQASQSLSGVGSGFQRSAGAIQAAAARAGAAVSGLGARAGAAFASLGAGAGLATSAIASLGAGAAVTGILRTAGDFEAAMNRVAAVSGATEAEFQALEDTAKRLGSTTRFSATEAAGGLEFLARAGFTARESVEALPGVLNLATAGGVDLARAADITSNVLSGFGLEVSELGRVNDTLVETFTSSNTNLEQLGLAFSYVAPIAKTAGLEIEEVAAAIGVLGDAGIQGSRAGTALQGGIARLLDPTKDVAAALREIGVSVDDVNPRFVDLETIMARLEPLAGNAELALRVFGLEAGPGMVTLLGRGSDAVAQYIDQIQAAGGITDRVAARMSQGLNSSLKSLASAWEGLTLAIADSGIQSAAQGVAEAVTSILRSLAGADPQILKFTAALAGITAAALAFIPVAGILAASVMAIGAPAVAVAAGVAALGAAIYAFEAPTLAAVAAVAALTAVFFPVTAPIAGAVAAITAAAAAFKAFDVDVGGVASNVSIYAKAIYDAVAGWIGPPLTAAFDAASAVVRGFVAPFVEVAKTIGRIVGGIIDTIGGLARAFTEFSGIPTAFTAVDAIGDAVDGIQQRANSIRLNEQIGEIRFEFTSSYLGIKAGQDEASKAAKDTADAVERAAEGETTKPEIVVDPQITLRQGRVEGLQAQLAASLAREPVSAPSTPIQVDEAKAEFERLSDRGAQAAQSLLPAVGATTRYEDTIAALEAAQKSGKITADIYNDAMVAAKIRLEEATGATDETTVSQERLSKSVTRISQELAATGTVAGGLSEALRTVGAAANEGAISSERYRELAASIQAAMDQVAAASSGPIVELGTRFEEAAKRAGSAWDAASRGMLGALDSFIETGKVNFGQFARQILLDIAKIQARQALAGLFGGGGGGGAINGAIGALGPIFGFADGGIVPGGTFGVGTFSSPALAMVGEGRLPEAVVPLPDGRSIPVELRQPPSQSAATGAITINNTFNLPGLRDTNDFRRQSPAIAARMAERARTDIKRNR